MHPIFQKIEANINHSFYVEHFEYPFFPNPFQFHPEVEILFVVRGTGTLIAGDSVKRFAPGDIVIIGQNVPHIWYSDKKYKKEKNGLMTEAIFILFKEEIFGEQFWNLPESKYIQKLIQNSRRGIKLKGETRKEVISLMKSINTAVGFARIAILFSILEVIASRKEYVFLASPVFQNIINQSDSDRLNKVYKYVLNNFQNSITLQKAASIANLSVPAFCRYFKKRTNKTFIRFLNEIKIATACRLLAEEDHPISTIGYITGFDNVSFFIRQFKRITGFTPLNYRKRCIDEAF